MATRVIHVADSERVPRRAGVGDGGEYLPVELDGIARQETVHRERLGSRWDDVADVGDRRRDLNARKSQDLRVLHEGDPAKEPAQVVVAHQTLFAFERERRPLRAHEDVVGGPVVALDRAANSNLARFSGCAKYAETGRGDDNRGR